jgi:hypothetical protein
VQASHQFDLFSSREALVQAQFLRDYADAPFDLQWLLAYVKARDLRLVLVGWEQPDEHINRRGFSRAIWTQKPEDNAAWHGEVQLIHRHNDRQNGE